MSQNNVSENMNLLNESESYIIFENQKIRDNVTNLNLDLNGNLNMDSNNVHFGILNIKTNKHDISILKKKIQHIVFDVDCSGSMSDICNDKRSKMDHINHTIINMIMFIVENPELMVFISVFAFDDKIYTIIENELISKENVETLVQQVRQIRPKNTTNIEKALTNSKEYIQKIYDCDVISKDNITITHIFMTDGDANQGITIPEELLQKCDLSISNIFIGFGIDHNAYLLKVLSSSNKNKYYFVDALEKAGLVYGEILHSIIYKIMENISISVKNGYIYDWKKNVWTDNMIIDDLVSDINKVFHILSENPSECEVLIESNNYLINEHFQYNIKSIMNEKPVQLHKYKYRQRTQELMFEVSKHNFNEINIPVYNHNNNYLLHSDTNDNPFYKERNEKNALLKEKMNALLEEMKKYCQPESESESETESEKLDDMEKNFMKLLCDDIYMCLQTIDTRYGAMYSCSRQVSQGEQRSYSATQAPNMNLMKKCIIPKLQRSYAFTGYNDDDDVLVHHNFDYVGSESSQDEYEEEKVEQDNKEYTVSEEIDTNPYTNLSVLNLMRCCSSTIDDNKLFR